MSKNSTARVAVVGSINRDTAIRVLKLPRPGETTLAISAIESGGGKGANQAVAAARAGAAATTLIGAIGDDPAGQELQHVFRNEGIDTLLEVVEGEATGQAFVSVSEDGENSIIVVPGANTQFRRLTPQAAEAVAQASVILCQLETPAELLFDVAKVRSTESLLILNAAPALPLGETVWDLVDLLIVNEHEAADYAGTSGDIDTIVPRLLAKVPMVVITLGNEGCAYFDTNGEHIRVPAHPVDAVDSTGAGDTFCGVFAARLALGEPIDKAMKAAAAAAAIAVTRSGAQSAIPTFTEVGNLLRSDAAPVGTHNSH
jgi:ribokinase